MKTNTTNITFEQLKDLLLYRKIAQWDSDKITLDNGTVISIEETEQDCCASAWGEFADVKLDAAITSVSEIEYNPWVDRDTYGCKALVKFMHNKNVICEANADADAGNGGYYYSVASFVVRSNGGNTKLLCRFVGSKDKGVKEDEEWTK